MKYLSSKPFTGGANSDAYRANFERMFGKKEPKIYEPEGKTVKSEEVDRLTMPTEEEWRDLWYRIDCRLELDRRNPERTDGTDSIRSWIEGAITKAVNIRMRSILKKIDVLVEYCRTLCINLTPTERHLVAEDFRAWMKAGDNPTPD